MQHFDRAGILQMERNFRVNLVNSLSGYKPANLIGTLGSDGVENLAIFSSVVHLGSDPALLGFIQRPIGEQSHTYKNIIASGFFTINHVSTAHVEQAHCTSARFEKEISEFKACGFTPRYAMGFTAPFVQEAPVQIGMRFVQEIKIELNDTRLMIGQIDHVFINDGLVDSDGSLRLEDAQVACISGLDTYFQAQRIARFPYAKPNPK